MRGLQVASVICLAVGCARSHVNRERDAGDARRVDARVVADAACAAPGTVDDALSWFEAYVRARCEFQRGCGTVTDLAACLDAERATQASLLPRWDQLVGGEVAFDHDAAGACLEATDVPCGTFLDTGFLVTGDEREACQRVFRPVCRPGEGDPCDLGVGCGSGLRCSPRVPVQMCGAASCEALASVGASCIDASCDPETSSTRLVSCLDLAGWGDYRCYAVERLSPADATGARCGVESVSGDRVLARPCAAWRVCEESPVDGQYRCAERSAGPSQLCAATEPPCVSGLECRSGRCEQAPPEPQASEGDPCTTGDRCDEQDGTRCVSGRCMSAGGTGESCELRALETGGVAGWCQPPLLCDPMTDHCVDSAVVEEGFCRGDSDCASGCCRRAPVSYVCQPPACCG